MTTLAATRRPAPPRPGDREVQRAWTCVAATPLVVVVVIALAEALATAMGIPDGGTATPVQGAVIIGLVVAALAVPTALAWRFERRAAHLGHHGGRVPAVVVSVLAGGFVAANLTSWTAMLLLRGA